MTESKAVCAAEAELDAHEAACSACRPPRHRCPEGWRLWRVADAVSEWMERPYGYACRGWPKAAEVVHHVVALGGGE